MQRQTFPVIDLQSGQPKLKVAFNIKFATSSITLSNFLNDKICYLEVKVFDLLDFIP